MPASSFFLSLFVEVRCGDQSKLQGNHQACCVIRHEQFTQYLVQVALILEFEGEGNQCLLSRCTISFRAQFSLVCGLHAAYGHLHAAYSYYGLVCKDLKFPCQYHCILHLILDTMAAYISVWDRYSGTSQNERNPFPRPVRSTMCLFYETRFPAVLYGKLINSQRAWAKIFKNRYVQR